MTLFELKEHLTNNLPIPDEFCIFLCKENTYLADQYVEAICKAKGLEYLSVKSIFDQFSALTLIMPTENNYRVMRVDEFSEAAEDYSVFTNTAVICSKLDKKLESLVAEYVIPIPKLEEWQVKAYISSKCPKLTEEELTWFYNATGKDIYRIENEIDKVALFPEATRCTVFNMLAKAPGSDLFSFNAFALGKAIIQNNKPAVYEVLAARHCVELELFNLVNIMLGQVRDTLLATRNSGRPAEAFGIKSGRAFYLQQDFGAVSTERLKFLLKELSAIDLKVRTGQLDTTNKLQVDYLITRLMR